MDVEAGAVREPSTHLRMFVSSVIIHDQVHREFGGNAGLQVAQEGKELPMSMARLACGEHGAGGNVESGKRVVVPWRT